MIMLDKLLIIDKNGQCTELWGTPKCFDPIWDQWCEYAYNSDLSAEENKSLVINGHDSSLLQNRMRMCIELVEVRALIVYQ